MGKDICSLLGNIRNGNTQILKIRENWYTEKLDLLQLPNSIIEFYQITFQVALLLSLIIFK